MPKNLIMRDFTVQISQPDTLSIFHRDIKAAYWQVNGGVGMNNRNEADGFTLFKNIEHDTVFMVKNDLLVSIYEVPSPEAENCAVADAVR
jgi:hypothetical protein